jgi:DNA processing protein
MRRMTMKCSDEARHWLEILSIRGIKITSWLSLCARLGTVHVASMISSRSGRRELSRMIRKDVGEPDYAQLRQIDLFLADDDHGVLCVTDPGYPELLAETVEAPPVLFYRGNIETVSEPAICIVGSRRSSRRGLVVARELGWELSRRGFLVVSGMARGIDTVVHDGALAGGGSTCAVLGCGIDIAYPPENAPLAMEIARHGCVLSEFPPGTPPMKHHFPMRNRILSGMSLGVVVVEAKLASGAMITARWAADQGREVFAVPGPVEQDTCRGPHRLIKEGACLVEDVDDILAALPPCGRVVDEIKGFHHYAGLDPGKGSLDGDEKRIVLALDLAPKHIDELVQICHISSTVILPILLDLEMRGIIESCGGGTYAIAGSWKDHVAGNF